MTHDEAQAWWLLADDGLLDQDRQDALQAHLASCAECRIAVDRLSAADRELRAWGAATVPHPTGAPAPTPVVSRARPWVPIAIAAALAGITLGSLGGYAAGRRAPSAPPPDVAASPADGRTPYVLLLEEPGALWPPGSPVMRPGYFEWVDTLTARGQFEEGIRLAEDEGWYVGTDNAAVPAGARPVAAVNFSGMFIIRARDYDEAIAIARGSPHLRYGGLLVRRTF